METYQTAVSEQEIPCENKIETETKEEVKLLTLDRPRTKQERLDYLAYRDKQNDYTVSKNKKEYKSYNNKRKSRLDIVKSKEIKKVIRNTNTNVHHLVPRALNWSEHSDNKYTMKISAHEWLNALIWNKLLPYIILQMLTMHKTTLHEETGDEIIWKFVSIMEEYIEKWKFFNEKCFKSKYFIPTKL